MEFVDLNGETVSINLGKFYVQKPNSSKLHKDARGVITDFFKPRKVLEEISLKIPEQLYLDFFVPETRVAIEVQGAQHFKPTTFFHKDKLAFYKAQHRDKRKVQWTLLNNIILVEFNYNEEPDEWRSKLRAAFC
jgi:hypothetical protein